MFAPFRCWHTTVFLIFYRKNFVLKKMNIVKFHVLYEFRNYKVTYSHVQHIFERVFLKFPQRMRHAKRFCRLNVTPAGFSSTRAQQLLLFVVSACLFAAWKPFARCCNCAISCREKKTPLSRLPFPIFLSERIGRLRASRLTRTQADLSCVTCERVAQKVSEALHRMNGSINLYPVLIIADKNSGRVGRFLSNLCRRFTFPSVFYEAR